MNTKLPLIAIIGRVNVGKSTLFNKLIEQQKALISKIPGTTRDLNFGICEWRCQKFEVVDTGGLFESKLKAQSRALGTKFKTTENSIEFQVEKKVREILNKANLVLFLVDAKDGILKNDRLIAQLIKNKKIPHLLVANKIDQKKILELEGFKKLGLGNAIGIAAASGVGVGDLLDKIIEAPARLALRLEAGGLKHLNTKTQKHKNTKTHLENNINQIKVCIIGKPNVGKSSLLNKILGEDKVIVSPIPHTTREPQDTTIIYQNHQIKLIDTAGVRRKSKVKPNSLELAGIQMSIKVLKKSDIALFVLDISENLSAQDAQLAGLTIKAGVSVIFVANKYDLLSLKHLNTKTLKHDANYANGENNKNLSKELTDYIHRFFPFLTWAPIIFTSASAGKNCQKILKLVIDIYQKRTQKIDPEHSGQELNDFIKYLMKKMPPPKQSRKLGKRTKSRAYISKIVQVENVRRPIFEINVTNITKIPESYLRYLENNIRERFKFEGTPITLRVVRNKK